MVAGRVLVAGCSLADFGFDVFVVGLLAAERVRSLGFADRVAVVASGSAAVVLVAAAELEVVCLRLEVTTRPQRPGATRFYLAVGFQERPRRLIKLLERGDAPRTR